MWDQGTNILIITFDGLGYIHCKNEPDVKLPVVKGEVQPREGSVKLQAYRLRLLSFNSDGWTQFHKHCMCQFVA